MVDLYLVTTWVYHAKLTFVKVLYINEHSYLLYMYVVPHTPNNNPNMTGINTY